ncbi:acyl-CoA carboxylase epsilon subunit [Aldersonia sp. NBC_00410]|uniref:acyl-CoA carboxylase epsilon subunit n=1 Tax=Aldersonia sp. NBC_00410 TaxID=2975954 RepID=UPI00225103EF|nr:acyl-CoA carboxylase epsilon subunit [Aldersonia sp. NBC_00410]MCX5044512.1 acyl-CoA carboxylase epsilon subunit [Aldersonia sp. NBC_00410]
MTAAVEEQTLSDAELTELAGSVDGAAGADAAAEPPSDAADDATTIKVLSGNPDDVELAALVAVLAAASASAPVSPQSARPPENWGLPTLLHRRTPPFSPYAYPYVSNIRD